MANVKETLVTFSSERGAILVVGHGTRKPSGSAQFLNLVEQMGELATQVMGTVGIRNGQALIHGCFLELAEPSIEQTVVSLAENGCKQILVVPVLLFTAGHARDDIPNAVQDAANSCGIRVIGQTDSLGTHPLLVSLSSRRFAEVMELETSAKCPPNGCAQVNCPPGVCQASGLKIGRPGLAMVGRGTSDQAALDHMRSLTDLRTRQDGIECSETGFFAGGQPNIDSLLDIAATWPCDSVVVQPHLLFEGELIDQLRNKVLELRQSSRERNWLIARTLGADPKLAELFLSLAIEQLMNA
jgi:sirohydrochlorin cobaltochelatase